MKLTHPGITMLTDTELAEAAIAAGLLDACNCLEEQRTMFVEAIAQRFELPLDEARSFVRFAITASNESVDAFHFAHEINLNDNAEARADIIRWLWKLAAKADLRSDFSTNYIERIAHLFDMTGRDALDLRGNRTQK